MERLTRTILFLLTLGGFSSTASADPLDLTYDLNLHFAYDTNLTNAQRSWDSLSDGQATISLGASRLLELGFGKGLRFRVGAEMDKWLEASGLDRQGVEISAEYRWQNRFAFTDPFYRIALSYQLDDYAVGGRDSSTYKLQGSRIQPLSDTWILAVGGDYRTRNADEKTWDNSDFRLFAHLDRRYSVHWSSYGSFSILNGDIVTSSRYDVNDPAIADLTSAYDAWNVDTALRDTYSGNWWAYRIQGQTYLFKLGINHRMRSTRSVDASATFAYASAAKGITYQRQIYRLSWLMQF